MFMRDFHDQKDLFKTVHRQTPHDITNDDSGKVSWVDGQIYTIDVFLWFMARHGYTLQKTKKNLDFDDIGDTLRSDATKRREEEASMIETLLGKRQ